MLIQNVTIRVCRSEIFRIRNEINRSLVYFSPNLKSSCKQRLRGDYLRLRAVICIILGGIGKLVVLLYRHSVEMRAKLTSTWHRDF